MTQSHYRTAIAL